MILLLFKMLRFEKRHYEPELTKPVLFFLPCYKKQKLGCQQNGSIIVCLEKKLYQNGVTHSQAGCGIVK